MIGDEYRSLIGGLGCGAGLLGLTIMSGLPGFVFGLLLAMFWWGGGDILAFTVGTVFVGAVNGAALLSPAAFVMAALWLLLAGTLLAATGSAALVGLQIAIGGFIAIAGLTPLVLGEALWIGAGTLVVTVGLSSYGLHRYGLLVSGMLTE